jgi:predicted NBD/HSP70 family sugar kinase/putative N-acetylmannosamine-6-phosphate epimerase
MCLFDKDGLVSLPSLRQQLEGRLIASCQAAEGDAFRSPDSMARFAQAAITAGAAAIRANGSQDIAAIRAITNVPILGIQKATADDGRTLITPTVEAAQALHAAGASCVALDATSRGRQYGALERIRRIKNELRVPVFADVATVEEGIIAAQAGADSVLSTMRGYTADTAHMNRFDPGFIRDLARACPVPVIAEGRIHSIEEARLAVDAGALAVVVGTAITRPRDIALGFVQAIETEYALRSGRHYFVGLDLGGTKTKFGIVSSDGRLLFEGHKETPARAGRKELLAHLKATANDVLRQAERIGYGIAGLGIATAGWIDAHSGSVAYATENLPGWTGTPIAAELRDGLNMPTAVENDANALAVAERYFGAGREYRDFVCITLGTGVGGGCYTRGALNRGAHFFANALGHLRIVPDGLPCTCGQRGCLEPYCNAAALLRYGGPRFQDTEQLIQAGNQGDSSAMSAIGTLGRYLAQGCSLIVQMLDPEALILSGGLTQKNVHLARILKAELSILVPAWQERQLAIVTSPLGYYGGVLGAAAIAIENFQKGPNYIKP